MLRIAAGCTEQDWLRLGGRLPLNGLTPRPLSPLLQRSDEEDEPTEAGSLDATSICAPEHPLQSRATYPTIRSGVTERDNFKRSGLWPDGSCVGRGHGQPYLKPIYAAAIVAGHKVIEGRPNIGVRAYSNLLHRASRALFVLYVR